MKRSYMLAMMALGALAFTVIASPLMAYAKEVAEEYVLLQDVEDSNHQPGNVSVEGMVSAKRFKGQGDQLTNLVLNTTKTATVDVTSGGPALSIKNTTGPGLYVNGSSRFESSLGAVSMFDNSNPARVVSISAVGNRTGLSVFSPTEAITGFATTNATDATGILGVASSTTGRGVAGYANLTSGSGTGVYGLAYSNSGIGVYGTSPKLGIKGVSSLSDTGSIGVLGVSQGTNGTGMRAESKNGAALAAYSQSGTGVDVQVGNNGIGGIFSVSGTTGGFGGMFVCSTSGGFGLYSYAPSTATALYVDGRSVTTGTKSFRIDDPTDPENSILAHYCTEGSEPLNAYSGNVTTDAKGYACVELPDFFESINRDFRYQLTVIDSGDSDDFVMAKIAKEIVGNEFTIRTSAPNAKVSWRVEAVRNDRYVQKYGAPIRIQKSDSQRGKYLSPELYDLPKERGLFFEQRVKSEKSKP